jgi:hypothetical protein
MANLTDADVVDFFQTDPLPAGGGPGEDWPLYLGDPASQKVFLGTIAQVRLALAPLDLFTTTAPTTLTPGREGQKAYVSHDSVVDLWQYELGVWTKKLTNFVLATAAAPGVPVPVVALGAIQAGKVGVQLTLTATASEAGGAIAKVEFFDGGTKIGEAATTPYATSYVPTSAGTHYFTAKATDTAGRSTVSATREAVISAAPVAGNQLPTVSLNLTPSGPITLGSAVTLSAVAADSDGSIAKVEFFDGSDKVGEALTTPYATSYTPTKSGSRLLSAKATDNLGGTATASMALVVNAVPVAGNQLPAVSLSLTPSGPITLGSAVTLNATATDSDGTIAKVEFFDGADKVGEATSSPYSISYTPTQTGSRLLSAKATDNAGGTTTTNKTLEVTAAQATPTVPGAPTGLVATASTGSTTATIMVTGLAPSNNGGSPITDYNVYISGAATSANSFAAPASGNQLSFVDYSANVGTGDYFQFTALNAQGEGPKSAPSNTATPTGPAAPPATDAILSATLPDATPGQGDGVVFAAASTQQLRYNTKAGTSGNSISLQITDSSDSSVSYVTYNDEFKNTTLAFDRANGTTYYSTFPAADANITA